MQKASYPRHKPRRQRREIARMTPEPLQSGMSPPHHGELRAPKTLSSMVAPSTPAVGHAMTQEY